VRFAITGGLAGATQLVILSCLSRQGVPALAANATAFVLAAQLNFLLSSVFTWRDRRCTRAVWRRWLAFHWAIASMAVVNMAVFAVADTALPELAASAAGILVAAIGNFLIGDRVVFARPRSAGPGDTNRHVGRSAA
jgi:putative flippase GtrA